MEEQPNLVNNKNKELPKNGYDEFDELEIDLPKLNYDLLTNQTIKYKNDYFVLSNSPDMHGKMSAMATSDQEITIKSTSGVGYSIFLKDKLLYTSIKDCPEEPYRANLRELFGEQSKEMYAANTPKKYPLPFLPLLDGRGWVYYDKYSFGVFHVDKYFDKVLAVLATECRPITRYCPQRGLHWMPRGDLGADLSGFRAFNQVLFTPEIKKTKKKFWYFDLEENFKFSFEVNDGSKRVHRWVDEVQKDDIVCTQTLKNEKFLTFSNSRILCLHKLDLEECESVLLHRFECNTTHFGHEIRFENFSEFNENYQGISITTHKTHQIVATVARGTGAKSVVAISRARAGRIQPISLLLYPNVKYSFCPKFVMLRWPSFVMLLNASYREEARIDLIIFNARMKKVVTKRRVFSKICYLVDFWRDGEDSLEMRTCDWFGREFVLNLGGEKEG